MRDQHGDHECRGGDEDAVVRIGEEEQHQRPEIEGELEQAD